jgi:acyl carrier protein
LTADDDSSARKRLELILLASGITYPATHAEEWSNFLRGTSDLSLNELDLDSLSLNELAVNLEIRARVAISPQELSEIKTLAGIIERMGSESRQSQEESSAAQGGKTFTRFGNWIRLTFWGIMRDIPGSETPRRISQINKIAAMRRVRFFDEIPRIMDSISGFGTNVNMWSRRKLSRDVLLYKKTAHSKEGPPLIVFGGGARRPMMPMAVFLASLEGFSDFVIFIRPQLGGGYRNGILGLGPSLESAFPSLLAMVSHQLRKRSSSELPVVMGMSAGGLPALMFSDLIGARSVHLFGPNATDDPRWSGSHQLRETLDRRERGESAHDVTICFGADCEDAAKVPSWTRDIPGATIIPFPGLNHNVLYGLFERHSLRENLDVWLS